MIVVSKRLKELLTLLEIPLISFFDLSFYEGEESKHAPRDKFTLVKEPYYITGIEQYSIEKLNIDYRNSVFEYNTWEVGSSWTFYPISFENFESMLDFKKDTEKVKSILPRKLVFLKESKIPELVRLYSEFNFFGGDKFIISEKFKEEIEKLKLKGISRFLEIGYAE